MTLSAFGRTIRVLSIEARAAAPRREGYALKHPGRTGQEVVNRSPSFSLLWPLGFVSARGRPRCVVDDAGIRHRITPAGMPNEFAGPAPGALRSNLLLQAHLESERIFRLTFARTPSYHPHECNRAREGREGVGLSRDHRGLTSGTQELLVPTTFQLMWGRPRHLGAAFFRLSLSAFRLKGHAA